MKRLSNHTGTRARLMNGMMERCSVDLQQLTAERVQPTRAAALQSCEVCRNAVSCAVWLAATAGESACTPPSFCPNAKVFEALKTVLGEDRRSNQTGSRINASTD
ncbi:DUF6455 family protein [Nitratireductor sp. GISD-1A_MAKvit]|uniref:DUF6455 family protein n=1 Tax=Nitratireductor sp. GISD-1A_MAKvit TaxID=3234198 RepID=UPI0034655454